MDNPINYWYQKYLALKAKMDEMMEGWLKDRDGCFWDGVEEGKKAMKEQMMEEAVEGEVMLNPYPTICLDDCKNYDFKDGDKVKIIVINE